MTQNNWNRSVVRVGDGRGVVIETEREDRLVITAGHCLPALPPSHAAALTHERTYAKLLGPLGGAPTVYAECVFADPVADLAVLGCPDYQELSKQADAYAALMDTVRPLSIGGNLAFVRRSITLADDGPTVAGPATAESPAWVLSLDGRWFACRVSSSGIGLWIEDAAEPIKGGMSGSPIVTDDGAAIGVISTGTGAPNPQFAAQLPGWLLRSAITQCDLCGG
jgi:hypothetical protein